MLERLRFALKFANHELNIIHEDVLKEVEDFFQKYYNMVDGALQPVRSPLRSSTDPRYSTKRARAANMIPFGPARRTRQVTKRNAAI